MKILFVASEAVPFIKTGGLADVVGSLPKELKQQGLDVRVILPKYKWIKADTEITPLLDFTVKVGWRKQYCGIEEATYGGIRFYFVDNLQYFDRDGIYGFDDEAERYTFFCKAVLASLPRIKFCPDVIHLHDWQTAIISLLKQVHHGEDPFYQQIKMVFTIHNLQYQGIFPKAVLPELLDLSWDYYTPERIEFFDNVNFLKAGLVYSQRITTVSQTYAEEIQHPFFGEQLDGLLQSRRDQLVGIVNGIDYHEYDPETDPYIYKGYGWNSLRYKVENKLRLQRDLNLPVDRKIPIIGVVSRLANQKGLDLITRVLKDILDLSVQLVVLGTGDPGYEEMLRQAATRYPDRMSANLLFDNSLAHQIYAGADLFLMPSRFEPCGLSQLIAMRYGCLPIVRETGGLRDTVIPYNEMTREGYGFTFTNYNAHDMLCTIDRALSFYRDKPAWTRMRKTAMQLDFSWRSSATRYRELYEELVKDDAVREDT